MKDQPPRLQLVLPKSVQEGIEAMQRNNFALNHQNAADDFSVGFPEFDAKTAIDNVEIIGRMLHEQRQAESDSRPSSPDQDSAKILPIPNVPTGSVPGFELLPVEPDDDKPEFQTLPLVPGWPSIAPTITPENPPDIGLDGSETAPRIPSGFDPATPADAPVPPAFDVPQDVGSQHVIGPDDSRFQTIWDHFSGAFFPDRDNRPSSQRDDSPDKRSSKSLPPEIPRLPEQEFAPNDRLQDILPSVKSGCEAMIKLAELGGEIQKQLARLVEQKGNRSGVQFLRNEGGQNHFDLAGFYENNVNDDFQIDFEAFCARCDDQRPTASRSARRKP